MENNQLINIINAISVAGKEILEIYDSNNMEIEIKSDNSPLTKADKAANKILEEVLLNYGYPILSEEGKDISYEERKNWDKFWLIDPLDGTKEFINKNGEFTINVALIENGVPVLGVVYAPVLKSLYLGIKSKGAYKYELKPGEKLYVFPVMNKIKVKVPDEKIIVVASRSHFNKETEDYVNGLGAKYKKLEFLNKGSSLKLCMIAEGSAHIYPRFGPTMEWDTAAAHAVVIAAGGKVLDIQGKPLIYNKENLLNPFFVVKA